MYKIKKIKHNLCASYTCANSPLAIGTLFMTDLLDKYARQQAWYLQVTMVYYFAAQGIILIELRQSKYLNLFVLYIQLRVIPMY